MGNTECIWEIKYIEFQHNVNIQMTLYRFSMIQMNSRLKRKNHENTEKKKEKKKGKRTNKKSRQIKVQNTDRR